MRLHHSVPASAAMVAMFFVAPAASCAQNTATPIRVTVNQHLVAEKLLTGTDREKALAAAQARDLKRDAVTTELQAALIEALTRENARYRTHDAAVRRGQPSSFSYPEFQSDLARALIPLKLPAAIPALAGALGNGPLVSHALADFGDAAAPHVLAVADSSVDGGAIQDALLAMRFLVEERGTRPLSVGTIAGFRRHIDRRLTATRQDATFLWGAIDVAAAMDDPGLRAILQRLATDPEESRARGITDAARVRRTQKRAADRLAGVPAMPRRSDR